ncbi:hypothetical protein BH23BAC4_BH23BAC4_00020 [soil metagenome]
MKKVPNVTRIEIEANGSRSATLGWQVRIRRNGKRHTKFFSDGRHGGADASLVAAVAHRDILLRKLPESDPNSRQAWSNTGVVGLSVRDKDDGSGGTKTYVQTSWVDPDGRRRGASFSVEKWGLRRALWNACLRRYRENVAAGRTAEEPTVAFARAQEQLKEELAEERRKTLAAQAPDTVQRTAVGADQDGLHNTVALGAQLKSNGSSEAPLLDQSRREAMAQEHLAKVLFG